MKELSYVANVLLEIRRFDRTLTSEDIRGRAKKLTNFKRNYLMKGKNVKTLKLIYQF